MGKLKSYDLVDIQDYRGEVYLKPEADKVIADKDKEISKLKEQSSCTFGDDCLRVRQGARELLRQKYKRCLAMVRCCMADNHTLSQVTLNEITNHLQWLFNVNFFVKWAARWSKIADKFKEAK